MTMLDRSRDALLIERLHTKTMARGLDWAPTEHDGRYQVELGNFLLEIGEAGADGEAELIICGQDGKALELITAEVFGPEAAERGRLLAETYEAARRIALGVDQVIDGLIDRLG
jgi:hypothetical protein